MGEIKGFLVAILVAAMAMLGIFGFITDVNLFYGSNLSSNLTAGNASHMNSIQKVTSIKQNMTEMTENIHGRTLNATGNPELTDNRVDIIGGGYSALKMIYSGIDFSVNLVSDLLGILSEQGLPIGPFITIITAIIFMVIILAMISILVKWDI